jgi:hypothetical protein
VSNGAKEVLRVGDIWIPYFARSLDHFTGFFIFGIEVLFQSGDRILRVETSSLSSRLVCWRLWQNVELLSQPYVEGSVKMKLTLPKLGHGSPPGLLKLQSSIAGVKTPCIGMFFISLENY